MREQQVCSKYQHWSAGTASATLLRAQSAQRWLEPRSQVEGKLVPAQSAESAVPLDVEAWRLLASCWRLGTSSRRSGVDP